MSSTTPAAAHDPAWPDAWAALYDEMDVNRAPHLDFYAGLCNARTTSLLDLGCGTGSITLAMAARMAPGARVTGIDLSPRMIEIARSRAPQHDWRVGDISNPPVEGLYDLIVCCFHTFQVLVDEADLARAFGHAAAHLAPGGRFAFDIYRPNLAWLAAVDPAPHVAREFTDPSGRRIHVIEQGAAYDAAARVLSGSWTLHDAATGTALPVAPIIQRVRQYFPQDIARLLAAAGLVAEHHFGDLARAPASDSSKLQVYICRKA